ncbi:tetratricopeptide repeat protein [Brevundimonas lenta]|uniref:DUF1570 domain-containing protein n=1 Tax=Brevundimonas lenta TaxID=424796 RepID=A0A7W6NQ26_9CAUL|nr:hypothetical protein [Brevundimonas lenta]MBB4084045.1 hypothetical protein [Brevundimonas lenta]
MNLTTIVKAVAMSIMAATMLAAGPARAEWLKAESRNFVIYSQGTESSLRRYARTLELYDYILRAGMGMPLDAPPARQLPIFLVHGRNGLLEIHPGSPPHAAGTYFPASEGIFAAAFSDREMDFLLHEYFHHFSFQNGTAAQLPGWLVEGLAEYFMTAEVRGNTVRIGNYNANRADWLLNANWLPLEELLSKRPREITRTGHRDTYYPVAWLMTHWFMSDDTRRGQLGAYEQAVSGGADPVDAMESATGMTLAEIRSALRSYMRGSLQIRIYEINRPEPEITVTRLPESADDLLLLGQRLKVGVPEDQRAATAALVRQRAARHPDDPFAMLQLGHAELHFGEPEAGEAVLLRLLEIEPTNVEALQLLASRHMRLAAGDPENGETHMRRARGYLGRAYSANNEQYYTLYMLAQTREGGPGYPNENDLLTWHLAYERAPQLTGIRLGYASALMEAEEYGTAIALLEPLANAPHGGGSSDAAQELLERARAGAAPFTRDERDAVEEAASTSPTQPDQDASQPAEPEPAEGT